MTRVTELLASALLVCAAANAATINTTLTVNATTSSSGTTFGVSGSANFTGSIGNGTFSASIPAGAIILDPVKTTFTIILASGGTLTGNLSIPQPLLIGDITTGSVQVDVTGGTGTYAGATGSFKLTGSVSGSLPSYTLTNFTGPGTITTGGGGGPTGPPPPTISAVLDSASNTANVAPGSIFIVKGSSLCPQISAQQGGINQFNVPRPTVAPDGVKITFTASGSVTATDAILVYEYNPSGTCQLAAILPSTVAPGTYNVTVTNGTVSPVFATPVVQRKPALFTQDSSGGGLASVQNYISASSVDLNSFTTGTGKGTTISPAKPGQFMIAYGTGLGALVGGDNAASPTHDYNADPGVAVSVIVGGVSGPVAYAGRAGYAGEDQINFVLPSNAPTGCTVSLQLSVNGILSNTTFIAIAPDANSSACVQPGFTPDQLKKFDSGGTYTTGGFSLTQFSISVPGFGNIKQDSIAGSFAQFSGYQLSGASGQTSGTPTDSCVVTRITTSAATGTIGSVVGLDAGGITLSGPAASGLANFALKQDLTSNTYSGAIATEGIPGQTNAGTIVAGTYNLKGAGGKGVGAFSASVTIGPPLNVTGGLPTNVVRSSGLPLTWTGGNSSDLVEIIGSSSTINGTGTNSTTATTSFVCTTTAGKGGFTVPASILTQLQAVSAVSTTGSGFLAVASAGNPTNGNGLFSAPLTGGGNIDSGAFIGFVGLGATVSFQ